MRTKMRLNATQIERAGELIKHAHGRALSYTTPTTRVGTVHELKTGARRRYTIQKPCLVCRDTPRGPRGLCYMCAIMGYS